jgi:hypothetical protein
MPKRIALLATAAALAVAPALAQQSTSPSQQGQSAQPSQQEQKSAQPGQQTEPAQPGQPKAAQSGQMAEKFVDAQSSDQWLGSTLIGLNVKGADDESIGSVSDLLVEEDGTIVAAVIGVGGFLGIGQKNVAVSFELLEVSRSPEGDEQATLTLTRAELENAPDFKPYEPPRPAASRPSGGETPGMAKKKPGSGM